jgi:hypothetical protein
LPGGHLSTHASKILLVLGTLLWTTATCAELPAKAYDITPTKDPKAPYGVYVPANLDDAFSELQRMLTPMLIDDMRSRPEEDMIIYHHGLGTWMRNNWALWQGSRLSEYFNGLGIHHPDDMSGIIITSFWRRLNNRPIDLDRQVAYYKAYWEKARKKKK